MRQESAVILSSQRSSAPPSHSFAYIVSEPLRQPLIFRKGCNFKRIWQHWSNLPAYCMETELMYSKSLRDGTLQAACSLCGLSLCSLQSQPAASIISRMTWNDPAVRVLPAADLSAGILPSWPGQKAQPVKCRD